MAKTEGVLIQTPQLTFFVFLFTFLESSSIRHFSLYLSTIDASSSVSVAYLLVTG